MTSNGEVPIDRSVTDKINAEISSLSKKSAESSGAGKKRSESRRKSFRRTGISGTCRNAGSSREEAKAAIKKCSAAHIKTVMITGDHKETAMAVAKEAGLLKGGKAVTGSRA